MKISKRIQEQIKLESGLPSEIIEKFDELRNQGFSFEPINNTMNENHQMVYYSIGTKNVDWE